MIGMLRRKIERAFEMAVEAGNTVIIAQIEHRMQRWPLRERQIGVVTVRTPIKIGILLKH